ncbi:MAG: NAD(P)-dependent oxidoreductase [Deltaproteobacteria bacterium]|nr:NAD(P)-dependent oxidoreductase [Deltaproteobacteria bacterium]MBW2307946.1 NAD(P)-dependent oxidoreductase [Deltaproteobacteria bacterium]
MNKIGFIGLGKMGAPMARRLVEAKHEVVGFDLHRETLSLLSGHGIVPARSAADVASQCDPVMLSLPSSRNVEAAIMGSDGVLASGKAGMMVIDMSSSSPVSTRDLAVQMKERGAEFVDAPVSGRPAGAAAGTLTIMVGGTAEQYQKALPVLSVLGKKVIHVGGVGAAHTLKAINNFLSATNLVAAAEAFTAAVKAGLDPAAALDVINQSSGHNEATRIKFPQYVLNGRFDSGFTVGLMNKDVGLFLELIRDLGLPSLLAGVVGQVYTLAALLHGPESDNTEIVRLWERWADVEIRTPER